MTLRRDFLAFTAGAVAARTVLPMAARAEVPADHPDAALIATCAAFDELERAYKATDFDAEIGSTEEAAADAEREHIVARQEPLVDRMVELRASTREGMAARAASLALWWPALINGRGRNFDDMLTMATLRDLLAGPRLEALTADAPTPDAKLLALCTLFHQQHAAVTTFSPCDTDELQDEFDALMDDRWETAWAINDMAPASMAGVKAKARVALATLLELRHDDERDDSDITLAIRALRDLTGKAAA